MFPYCPGHKFPDRLAARAGGGFAGLRKGGAMDAITGSLPLRHGIHFTRATLDWGGPMKNVEYIGRARVAPPAAVPPHLAAVRGAAWFLRALLPVVIALLAWTWIQHRLGASSFVTWLIGCGLGFCLAWLYEPAAAVFLPAECPKTLSLGWDGLSVRYLAPLTPSQLRGFYLAPIVLSFLLTLLGFIILGAEAAFQSPAAGFAVALWGMSFLVFLSIRDTFAAGADILCYRRQWAVQTDGNELRLVYWQGRLCRVKTADAQQ